MQQKVTSFASRTPNQYATCEPSDEVMRLRVGGTFALSNTYLLVTRVPYRESAKIHRVTEAGWRADQFANQINISSSWVARSTEDRPFLHSA